MDGRGVWEYKLENVGVRCQHIAGSRPSPTLTEGSISSGAQVTSSTYTQAVIERIKQLHYCSDYFSGDPVMKYSGTFKSNLRQGFGCGVFWNGDIYLGEWGGCSNNSASCISSSSTTTDANWECMHGWGRLLSENYGNISQCTPAANGGEEIDDCTSVYVGEFINGKRHGVGSIFFGSLDVSLWTRFTANTPLHTITPGLPGLSAEGDNASDALLEEPVDDEISHGLDSRSHDAGGSADVINLNILLSAASLYRGDEVRQQLRQLLLEVSVSEEKSILSVLCCIRNGNVILYDNRSRRPVEALITAYCGEWRCGKPNGNGAVYVNNEVTH
jgi:hypothetical protein